MNVSATSTPSTPSIPAVAAVLLRVLAASFPRRHREPRPVLAGPQRFGDSYRWPDGSWTSSG